MTEKNQFQNLIKSILRHKDGRLDHEIMHPLREWMMCLFVTVTILSIMVFFCVRLYRHYTELTPEQNTAAETAVPGIVYRAEEVDTGLKSFDERRITYETLKQSLIVSKVTLISEQVVGTTTDFTGTNPTSPVLLDTDEALTPLDDLDTVGEVTNQGNLETPLPVTESI